MCRANNVRPALHLSVLERLAHGTEDYAPGNLPAHAEVVITPTGDREKDEIARQRAQELQAVLGSVHAGEPSLLSHVKAEIVLGLVSYYGYLLSCIAAVIAVSAPEGLRSLLTPWLLAQNVGLLIANLVTLQLGEVFMNMQRLTASPELLGVLAGGFLVSSLLALYADRRMRVIFSQFWHQGQPQLRAALKRAR